MGEIKEERKARIMAEAAASRRALEERQARLAAEQAEFDKQEAARKEIRLQKQAERRAEVERRHRNR